MATLQEPYVLPSGGLTNDESGFAQRSLFILTDVAGDPDATEYNALTDPQIPQPYDPHPTIPKAFVTRREASTAAGSNTTINIVVTWSYWPIAATLDIYTTLTEEETIFDSDGLPITVTYNGVTQGGTVTIQVPVVMARFTIMESVSGITQGKAIVGTTNDSTFLGEPSETWLCTQVQGVSQDGEETYLRVYEFQFKKPDWKAVVAYIDPETNQPPPDLVQTGPDAGVKRVSVYPTSDFNILGLIP